MISRTPRRRHVALLAGTLLICGINVSPAQAAPALVQLDTKPPSAPTGLKVQQLPEQTAALSWNASRDDVGVVSYAILRNGVELTTTSGLSVTLLAQPNVGTLYYQVLAIDAAGNRSAKTAPVLASFDTIKPSAPKLTGRYFYTFEFNGAGVANTVDLRWTAVAKDTDVVEYVIFRNGVELPSRRPFDPAQAAQVFQFPMQASPLGTKEWFQVQAVDRAGNRSVKSAPVQLCRCDATTPGGVSNFVGRLVNGVARLSWDAATDDSGQPLRYHWRTDAWMPGTPEWTTGDGSDTYLDVKDVPGRVGFFYVQAIDSSGNAGPWVKCPIEIPLDGVVLLGA